MTEEPTKILASFHTATGLPTYLFTANMQLVQAFTGPMTPAIPQGWLAKLPQQLPTEVNLFFTPTLGLIGLFPLAEQRVVVWSNNASVQGSTNYSDQMPLTGVSQFKEQLRLLYFMLTQRWPQFSAAQLNQVDHELTNPTRTPRITDGDADRHAYYQGYLAEQQMLLGVEHGNLTEFNQYYVPFMAAGNFGKLANYDLRSKKNITIAATTLFTRAAIRGGMFAEGAYALSDQCIQTAEHQTTITNVYEYTRAIGELFLKNVARIKRQNIPSIIYLAQEYIYDNVQTIKTVAEVAAHVHTSESYLMHLFKQTTGSPIMQFIITQKIQYARLQLVFTDQSIGDLSDTLGFANQGELTRAFKKQLGVTPSKFRQQQQIL
ncbi:helix-turn-helix domain-containing protein [Lactiplantibacillus songbeiensis]|uniref:Helix-turn-helix domain-containing protein n=1 Tax=Lactiplantibacillus songbeiensis TaxID=2559920 RepID=A0ABW4BYB1_9LACO|nr:helix-turn-helix domain-containing protein [Lactiplantibacillus songbeiensis]